MVCKERSPSWCPYMLTRKETCDMKSGEHFDVIIFCAYELIKEKPELNILMIEKGRPIEKRVCPKRKTKVCVGCKPCSITTGFAGAGAFSDGKLSLSPDVGGNLPEILGYDKQRNSSKSPTISTFSLALIRTYTALTNSRRSARSVKRPSMQT